ncbi:AcrR family transcriptional regulator [Planomicrobium koreense]|uniref:AcrR family transcriptional regulator n=1 Tax=Planococcus koreensis TaxID=112331 RepID=A0A7W8CT33_9BACL|nr:TetR/AcrR family transcriptional regulator [Planococcus koreensis]MBB5181152.1 AcrR family transcriptional regulator [Planococcus koreensis]
MKTDLRVLKTKDALHESLLSLLKERALESISITEICKAAKINRGTFYQHYGKVEDLFEEYFKEIMKDLAESYQAPYKYVERIETTKLNPATIRIFHHIEKFKKFYFIVFSKNVPLAYYYLLFDEIHVLMKEDFIAHQKIDKDVAVDMLSAYQSNAILGMVIEWYRQDFNKSAAEMNEQLVAILNLRLGG